MHSAQPSDSYPNLLDAQIYLDGSAATVFRDLRQRAPIFRHPDPSDDGDFFWAMSNYAGRAPAFRHHDMRAFSFEP